MARPQRTSAREPIAGIPGWEQLRHGGLLLDSTRLASLNRLPLPTLSSWAERILRQYAQDVLEGSGDASRFVKFVFEEICGFNHSTGTWRRGSRLPATWARKAVTGEQVKPNHLWKGTDGGQLPVFLDTSKRVGIGKGRRLVSQVLGWLRAGGDHLAVVTNGRQWRLVYAGLDFDAWCEWDVDLWFEEGEVSPQVTALRSLLRPALWTPEADDAQPKFERAIRDTRKGQADLSAVLGERVREAVEILIRSHGEALRTSGVEHSVIYRAACRVVMRLVVILFAESRDLLPRENSLYHENYGLQGLLEQLERKAASGTGLTNIFGAWPRVLALFALVRDGSFHPELPVPAYGGDLFAPGASEDSAGISQALSVFEQACFEHQVLSDSDLHEMLNLLTRTRVRVRQGRSGTWAVVPVDFSDLSSEYIGILYEGLLDYELKIAPDRDPVIFVAVAKEPALPLSRLEAMDDRALKSLFIRFADKSKKAGVSPDAEIERGLTDECVERGPSRASPTRVPTAPIETMVDDRLREHSRVEEWARQAVLSAGILRKPRGRQTPESRLAFDRRLGAKAGQLVARVVLPGEWYLVRWGGTRKGSGSFFTRPGLAPTTVSRTLRPLAYDPPSSTDSTPDKKATLANWTPKLPEHILRITVCDPACGSGTFPLASLRFLTDSVYNALQYHGRLRADGNQVFVYLFGVHNANSPENSTLRLADELIPCRSDDDRFEPRLKAVLRRHVVERCIYAVDLDPLAVELCRLSLWLETMDRTLPFGFLDHKIKCGNSLIGAWFDQFRHYPVMAWKNRDGGDRTHVKGQHFDKNKRTKAIKRFVTSTLTPDLKRFLSGTTLFNDDPLEQTTSVHEKALSVLEDIHSVPVHDASERARLYREKLVGSDGWNSLKQSMDLWCACWFWPLDEIDHAPLPSSFAEPSEKTQAISRNVASEMRFFHWELEFPDVFRRLGSGFDAIVGNPPWDIAKPASLEFFSNLDPLYRSYGKQEALYKQWEYFADIEVETSWLNYNAQFHAQSNFMSHAARPFGDPIDSHQSKDRFSIQRGKKNLELHERWRNKRKHSIGFSDPAHPFRYQGSADLNLYKLFLESAYSLLTTPDKDVDSESSDISLRQGGRLGFIVPSGLHSDRGTRALRGLFLEHSQWEWLFGIENRTKIFPIDSRYKFDAVVIEKGGRTEQVQAVFMQHNPHDWNRAEQLAIFYNISQIKQLSPMSHTFLEVQSKRDLDMLEKVFTNGVVLGDDGPSSWEIQYATEFHMTADARLFPTRPSWEARGYRPDEYSRWLMGDWRPIEELWESLDIGQVEDEYTGQDAETSGLELFLGSDVNWSRRGLNNATSPRSKDIIRTSWHFRCAQPPYDRLPVSRSSIPPGVVLSREGDAWISESNVTGIAQPFYEGRMIGQCDVSKKGWVSGKGRQADWREIPWHENTIDPQYLMSMADYRVSKKSIQNSKIAYMRVSSSTNTRSTIAAYLGQVPAGDSVFFYVPRNNRLETSIILAGVFSTFVFDEVVRLRLGGLNLSKFVMDESALPSKNEFFMSIVLDLSASLNLLRPSNSTTRIQLNPKVATRVACITPRFRTERLIALDAVTAFWFGLSSDDVVRIFNGCDYPVNSRRERDPKGFWRVDKEKFPELRQTVLTIVAFRELESRINLAGGNVQDGVTSFLEQNGGQGWTLPESLRLADFGLGHDERARQPQPVSKHYGPRYYDWQLAQDADEYWRECHLHARNLSGEIGYSHHIVDIINGQVVDDEASLSILEDTFVRNLLGCDGYINVLLELLARKIVKKDHYWKFVDRLQVNGQIDATSHVNLLHRLKSHPDVHEDDFSRQALRILSDTKGNSSLLLNSERSTPDQEVSSHDQLGLFEQVS